MLPEGGPRMNAEEFRLFRDLTHDYCGIYFQDDSQQLVERRLVPRMAARSLPSWSEYYRFLRYHPNRKEELEEIVERVTTNETYFFREPAQLQAFIEEIVPDLMARKSVKKIRIWSAGCSSGEEAYSIAMLLEESGWYDHAAFEIFASDINQQVLAKARKGHYRENAFRATQPTLREKYFRREADGSWHIRDEIRNRVSFGRLNLYDEARVSLLGHLDVVFCRNVIIYFDDASKKVVVNNFYNRLIDGGYLLLGHSESLISLSTQFKLRHLKNDMVYQK
jgi:chemotaxis protein methyltransferase CheR